ncbi:PD-(D/E)XK nuclease family protein [Polaribacter uvawellassae]|uniref:PD-(D/E)XK nuclease family protein n=1 Tax=Polaribacter uvawellassae TaxID=3133495 RepID=UPI00321961FE
MQTFITETLQTILTKQQSFENTVFVLPSQRAGVFVKQALKETIDVGFLPTIFNIEQFIEEISGLHKIDSIQLLFHFYAVYKKVETEPEDFENFISWAFTVVQDFNEVDKHLINPKEIFPYLRDIQRLKNWSVKKPLEETKMIKNHFSFLEKLEVYYTEFYKFLLEKQIGYQGLIYREATKNIEIYIEKNKLKKFVFMGFNALNKSEEYLFQELLSAGNTDVYWDIDSAFLKNNHQAGTFIRKYKSEWKYYIKNPIATVSSNFELEKNIEVIGASKNTTQIKYAGELINKLPNHNKTAYVLADESLLPITLNSLPKKVEAVNITMGYPLKDVPTTSLFFAVFQLFLTQEKLNRTQAEQFYYKDVLQFFKHASIQPLLIENGTNVLDKISLKIAEDNDAFIDKSQIESFLSSLEKSTKEVVIEIFNPIKNSQGFISRILNLIVVLKEKAAPLEKEYLFRFYTIFSQLQTFQNEYNFLKTFKTIHQLFNQLLNTESISFKGEPLQGLQLMGMLETRVLDFENVIITSVNENILPKNSAQNTFIPFDVKIEFGLPTYREKDAIFSYHFFRLLQRAKNIYLLYNSESDTFGGGEKSRFITQLLHLKDGIKEHQISPKVTTEKTELKEIEKTPEIISLLKEVAKGGFSPSTLANYLYNPYQFYTQKILKLKEYNEVEETVASNTMGTIIHDTLDALYQPYINKYVLPENFKNMFAKVDDLVSFYFKKHFHNSDIFTGKNRLIFEVSKDYVNRFLENEKQLVSEKNQLKIIATEENLETTIEIEGFNFPIIIKGQVDRIDELNGITRIIDYKTGKVEAKNLKISDVSDIADEKYNKAIQVLLYGYMYAKSKTTQTKIESGIISFKNLNSGFLKVDFGKKDYEITEDRIEEFMNSIKDIIKEIFDISIPFTEKIHEKHNN